MDREDTEDTCDSCGKVAARSVGWREALHVLAVASRLPDAAEFIRELSEALQRK